MANLSNKISGIPMLPSLPPWLAFTQGTVYHVKPYSGSDGNTGLSVDKALKTLSRAQTLATADQNDIVLLYSESNTAASTTDYQSSTLSWAKDGVHLIGVGSGAPVSSRARVAFASTYATASNLFTLSADNCYIGNISFYAGVASANPTGCMSLTGSRNRIENCHIAGFGDATMDIATGYSLSVNAGSENLIKDCYIGVDTITCGAAENAQIYLAGGATRNWFKNCITAMYTNHATNHIFLRSAASAIDRWTIFEDCLFLNSIDSGSTNLTQAAVIAASGSPAGGVYLWGKTAVLGATDWNSADSGNVTGLGYTVTAASFGLGADVTR